MIVKLVGKGAVLDEYLIIADIHIGLCEEIRKKGVLLPGDELKMIIRDINQIADEAKKIIINGDFKENFGKISKSEWDNATKLAHYLKKTFDDIIIIKGNHDVMIKPLAEKMQIQLKDYVIIGDTLITHGDKIIETDYDKLKNIIIGHQHASIRLTEGAKSECFKCHLIGNYNNCRLYVLPSFNSLTTGINIIDGQSISPYITEVKDMDVNIPDGKKVREFGKVSHWTMEQH
jgi:uncharacterized protein